MNPLLADLSDRERLLVDAVLAHDLGPIPRFHTANGNSVLKHAMSAAGVWDQERYDASGVVGEESEEATRWYADLIALSRRPDEMRLVEGFGNLGFDGNPPACPAYVKFAPTDLARSLQS